MTIISTLTWAGLLVAESCKLKSPLDSEMFPSMDSLKDSSLSSILYWDVSEHRLRSSQCFPLNSPTHKHRKPSASSVGSSRHCPWFSHNVEFSAQGSKWVVRGLSIPAKKFIYAPRRPLPMDGKRSPMGISPQPLHRFLHRWWTHHTYRWRVNVCQAHYSHIEYLNRIMEINQREPFFVF